MLKHVDIMCPISGHYVHNLCEIKDVVSPTEFTFFNLSTRKEGYFNNGTCAYRVCGRIMHFENCIMTENLSEIPVEVMQLNGLIAKKLPEMTAQQFNRLGCLLHGESKWKDPLAKDLNVNRSTIDKLSKGAPIKDSIAKECVELLIGKYDEIGGLLGELGYDK